MLRLLLGLALLPSSVLTLAVAVEALGVLAREPAALPFLAGIALCLALRLLGRRAAGPSWLSSLESRLYVFGHELTHALAAWSFGAKVLGFKVSQEGGHVDLSRSNAFVALAPYCLPIYSILTVLAYRLLLAFWPVEAHGVFLAALGLTLFFHLIKTFECLWASRQPDLSAAGGVVFSLAAIALANALVVLLLVKVLFPGSLSLWGSLKRSAELSFSFWVGLARFLEPLRRSLVSQASS